MWADKILESHAKPWHAADIEEMGSMIFNGKSIPEIAASMGRSQEAVRTKAHALDMLPKRARRKAVSGGTTPFILSDRR